MADKIQGACCGQMWPSGAFRSQTCGAKAKVERNGNSYCGRHDPEKQAAYIAQRDAKWEAKWAAERATEKAKEAAADLQRAKAAAFDWLMETGCRVSTYGTDVHVVRDIFLEPQGQGATPLEAVQAAMKGRPR